MAHAPLDEHFDEHPKYEDLELDHFGLMACALSYCTRNLTDGFVSDRACRRFGRSGKGPRVAAELVRKGIWERAENGYRVVGFLDHNPSRTEVLAKREAARLRKENQRKRDVSDDVTRDVPRDGQRDSHVTSRAGVLHSTALHSTARQEIPPKPPPGGRTSRTRSAGSRLCEDWKVSKALYDWALLKGISRREVERVAENFRDYWLSSSKPNAVKADWDAAFRTWIRNAIQRGEIAPLTPPTPPPPPETPEQRELVNSQRRLTEAAVAAMQANATESG